MKIEKIQKGVHDIVIVVNMLREGFDYPPFSIAGIVTTSIMSLTKFAQFVGRIQRVVRHEEDGVIGDIVTHKYFKQGELYTRYTAPHIAKDEDELLDDGVDEE